MSLSWCLGHFAGRIWVPLRCDGSLLIIKIVLSDSIMKHFHCYDRSLFWDGYALFFSTGHVGLLSGLMSVQRM